jgi:hypothetical protein
MSQVAWDLGHAFSSGILVRKTKELPSTCKYRYCNLTRIDKIYPLVHLRILWMAVSVGEGYQFV